MNRAERRRREREQRRRERTAKAIPGRPVGVLTDTGFYDQGSQGHLPEKEPGRHRWVLLASYTVTEEAVFAEARGDGVTYLDHENRFATSLGCIDCEQPYPHIQPGSHCPAADFTTTEGDPT